LRLRSELPMISQIKFLVSAPGEMIQYETHKAYDLEVSHSSFSELSHGVARGGRVTVVITQGGDEILDEASYASIRRDKRVAVLYRAV
jgi:hypothetical protein